MLVSPAKKHNHEEGEDRDPLAKAIYPLAVPFLLNPAGIATLVITSSEIDSILYGVIVIGLVLLVGALDFAVFRNMDKLAQHLDPSRLVITEAIFGVLLSALAVQLFVDGLADLGIIAAVPH
jgi:multiple antibiotic resistance protein